MAPKRKESKQSSGGSDDEDYRKKRDRNNQVIFSDISIIFYLNHIEQFQKYDTAFLILLTKHTLVLLTAKIRILN